MFLSKPRLIISIICLSLLLFSVSIMGTIGNIAFCIYAYLIIRKTDNHGIEMPSTSILALILIELLFFFFFQRKWTNSTYIMMISEFFHLTPSFLVYGAGLLLCLFSSYSIYLFSAHLKDKTSKKEFYDNSNSGLFELLICAFTAFCLITICSKSSFLYPFNDWDDSNCYFTMGKSMMKGIVLYRDLYEQKGPLLYSIHGIASLISFDSFFGIYLSQLLIAAFSFYYMYRIMKMYTERKIIIAIPIIGLILYTAKAYVAGDSAEEISFPFLVYSLFLIIKTERTKQKLSAWQLIKIGICSGCVFWIKFSLIGMYIGWFITYSVVHILNKDFKQPLYACFYIFIGVLLSSLPFIIYFGINSSIKDWLEVYLYNNLFLYGDHEHSVIVSCAIGLWEGFKSFLEFNPAVCNLCIFCLLAALCNSYRNENKYLFSMLISEFIFIFVGGVHQTYYSYDMGIFILFAFVSIYQIFADELKLSRPLIAGCAVLCVAASFFLTPNRYLMGINRSEMPQYRFNEKINKINNPTMLNYGFLDGGFYTVSGIYPNCKYFCKIYMDLPEMIEMQDYYAENGLCDFIVTRSYETFNKYEIVDQVEWFYNGNYKTYYLYELIK